jgi:hypothetical protein
VLGVARSGYSVWARRDLAARDEQAAVSGAQSAVLAASGRYRAARQVIRARTPAGGLLRRGAVR